MKVWARVGVMFDVNEIIYKIDPQLAILTALHEGRATLDGETYIPDLKYDASPDERHIAEFRHSMTSKEISFDFVNISIKA